ncbi:MAG: hypothetical protein NTZ67_03250 [Gammaproteobacteria bacterium]|nr:hypothetical protein [Gammaproteobacteria bacterium]
MRITHKWFARNDKNELFSYLQQTETERKRLENKFQRRIETEIHTYDHFNKRTLIREINKGRFLSDFFYNQAALIFHVDDQDPQLNYIHQSDIAKKECLFAIPVMPSSYTQNDYFHAHDKMIVDNPQASKIPLLNLVRLKEKKQAEPSYIMARDREILTARKAPVSAGRKTPRLFQEGKNITVGIPKPVLTEQHFIFKA